MLKNKFGGFFKPVLNDQDLKLVTKLVQFLEEEAISIEGIFRIAGFPSEVNKLREYFEKGEDLDISCADPHVIASLFKLYFRNLKEPLLTFQKYDSIIEAAATEEKEERYKKLIKELSEMPRFNRIVFQQILQFLAAVHSNSKVNKMPAIFLAIIFAPYFLRPKDNNIRVIGESVLGHKVIEELIVEYKFFIRELEKVPISEDTTMSEEQKRRNEMQKRRLENRKKWEQQQQSAIEEQEKQKRLSRDIDKNKVFEKDISKVKEQLVKQGSEGNDLVSHSPTASPTSVEVKNKAAVFEKGQGPEDKKLDGAPAPKDINSKDTLKTESLIENGSTPLSPVSPTSPLSILSEENEEEFFHLSEEEYQKRKEEKQKKEDLARKKVEGDDVYSGEEDNSNNIGSSSLGRLDWRVSSRKSTLRMRNNSDDKRQSRIMLVKQREEEVRKIVEKKFSQQAMRDALKKDRHDDSD